MIRVNDAVFVLNTQDTTYAFWALPSGQLEHLYYGKRLKDENRLESLAQPKNFIHGNLIAYDKEYPNIGLEDICLEASGCGKGDIREPFVELEFEDGTRTTDFIYDSYEISTKKALSTLPSSYDETNQTETLTVTLKEKNHPVQLKLLYSVFEKTNVITRSAVLVNYGDTPVVIRRLMSLQLDLERCDYKMTCFGGAWAREMNRYDMDVLHGRIVNDSKTGLSSNRRNPFIMLYPKETNQDMGACYGCNLIYSGNHYEAVEVNSFGKVRLQSGIQPDQFSYVIEESQQFETPEAVLTYSNQGFTGMSHQMHSFIQNHIVCGTWKKKERPVLINSWESAYFHVNEGKLLSLAKTAAKVGIELFVLDDGWFGQRNNDQSSLGDWTVNKKKFPHGLERVSTKIEELGMKFGIWVEPEMINEDSELYRSHPEYAMRITNQAQSLGRNQMILDLTKPEVCRYVIDKMRNVFSSGKISYVKWDMNRIFTDVYSDSLPVNRQGEVLHRYYLGLYSILDTLTKEFPEILFESCSSGGNRFDLGMLCYMPQIWASDNTDAICRTTMLQNISYGYPLSVVGAHVSACPNHQTLRMTSLDTRFHVACFGLLGYECNLNDLSSAELDKVKEQVNFYKEHRKTLQFGTFYRIKEGDKGTYQWCIVNEDTSDAIALHLEKEVIPNQSQQTLRLKGLNEDSKYHFKNMVVPGDIRDFGSLINTVAPITISQDSLLHNIVSKFVKVKGEMEDYELYGDALMYAGVKLKQSFAGIGFNDDTRVFKDFDSRIYVIN